MSSGASTPAGPGAAAARLAPGHPVLARTKAELAAARSGLPGPVVLVPTMGALHGGHRALLRLAREISGPDGSVLVSVFVNPLQFGAGEDFDRYPRTLEHDLAVCAEEGAAVVFAPPGDEMYPCRPWSRSIRDRRGSCSKAAQARVLRRRADRGAEAVPARRAGRGGVRPEGRAAAGAGPADGRRPRPRRADRRGADRARPGRAGDLQPERLPVAGRAGHGAGAAPRAARPGPGPRRAGRPRCSRRPGPCSARPRPPTRRSGSTTSPWPTRSRSARPATATPAPRCSSSRRGPGRPG